MFQLAGLLRSQGHQIDFWGMKGEKNIVGDNYGCFAENVEYSLISGLKSKLKSSIATIYSRENQKKIAIALKQFRPDIVHVHNYNFQLTPAILPVIKKSGAKIVHTLHDTQLVCPYHRFFNFQDDSTCTKCAGGSFWHCITSRCFDNSLFKSTLGAMESYFYHTLDYYNRFIDVFISPSEFLARHVMPRIKKSIFIVPNFSEDAGFSQENRPKKSDYVLYFGRISREKGILEMQKDFIRSRIKLVIIGSGPQQDRILRSSFTEYLGPKHGSDLLKYIFGSRLVIQPSRAFENCPMAVIESFMCSTPVIAPNKGGFVEMIENGRNGFLLDFDDPRKWSVLRAIFESDTNYMHSFCRSTYLKKYSPQRHLLEINRIYKELLDAKKQAD